MLLILKATLHHSVLSKNTFKFKIIFKNYVCCQHLKASQVTKKKPIGLTIGMKVSLEMTKYVLTSGLFWQCLQFFFHLTFCWCSKLRNCVHNIKSGIILPLMGEAVKSMRLRPQRVKTLKDVMIPTNKITNHR